ncbi:MAG: hypothetical protein ACRD88_14950, partial [Terriglobia bacterium]
MHRPVFFPQHRNHRPRSLVALVFLACTSVAVFSPVVLGGRFFGLADPGVQIYPALAFFARYLREYGEVPLWNPLILSGQPLYLSSSATVGGFFYPIQLLYAVFEVLPLYHWLLVAYFILAAWCTFAVSRSMHLSISASTIAACAATFNQFTFAWGINNINYYVFWILPALLWILLRMDALAAHRPPTQTHSPRFPLSWVLLLFGGTLTIGLSLLAGHPQFILYALTAAALASLFLDIRRARAVPPYRRGFHLT